MLYEVITGETFQFQEETGELNEAMSKTLKEFFNK